MLKEPMGFVCIIADLSALPSTQPLVKYHHFKVLIAVKFSTKSFCVNPLQAVESETGRRAMIANHVPIVSRVQLRSSTQRRG